MNKISSILEGLNQNRLIKESLEKYFSEHDIKPLKSGIGFSEKEQKWYGWSHRAIYGFGIGHKVKEGDAGYEELGDFECKSLDDCRKVAEVFHKSVS